MLVVEFGFKSRRF